MRLTVLGCSGSLPGPASPASSYLVEADGARILLDLGSGALGPLQRHAALTDIDAVLVSHLHPDHYIDLCGLYVALRYGPHRRHPVPVWGPSGTAHRMADAYGLPRTPGMAEVFEFHPYPDGEFEIGPFTMTTKRVAHPVEAYAIRVEHDGNALAYSGDTGPTRALTDLAAGADLLLCEAAFADSDDAVHQPDLHLTGADAGRHAQAAGVGRLIVTHVPPWGDAERAARHARNAFDGPVDLAAPDRTWEIG